MEPATLDFQKDVIKASKSFPVVVDFWAEWCGPCKILGPVLEKLANDAGNTWRLVKVNTDEHPQLSTEYGIRGIPAVKMFYNGSVSAEFVGALPEVQVRKWLAENIPSESQKLVAEAEKSLADGDERKAQNLLNRAIDADETNFAARIHLAKLIFGFDATRAEELVQNTPEESPLYKDAEAIQTLSRILSFEFKKDDTCPKAWDFYLKGIQAFRRKDYEAALKNWIEALILDKKIDDDGPRKACVAVFGWLGLEHDLTQKYHRSFTSALF